MASQFYNILQEEMEEFLFSQEFQKLTIPGTVELVYGKALKLFGYNLSLRVYTGINPSGESRQKGEDAIRVKLFVKYKSEPTMVGQSRRCNRVAGWEKNLQNAINAVAKSFHLCPNCKNPMVERDGRNGKFDACITWHDTKCPGRIIKQQEQAKVAQPADTRHAPQQRVRPNPSQQFRLPPDKISPEQQQVTDLFVKTEQNLICESRAGGGKTTLLAHLASYRKNGEKMINVVFGKRNAKENKRKLPKEVPAMTTHSFLVRNLREHKVIAGEPEDRKNWIILNEIYPHLSNEDRKRIRKATARLIGLAKNYACKPDDEDAIRSVMDSYTFEFKSQQEAETALALCGDVLKLSLPKAKFGSLHDFDDWLWFSAILDIPLPKVHCVLADEVQDFNRCQVIMLEKLLNDGARIIIVGDPFQSVYRFRGADSDAFERVEDALRNSRRGCSKVLLPRNYRCSKAVIRFVVERTIVKDIVAHDAAPEGLVDEGMGYTDILDLLEREYGRVAKSTA